jgi:uncharacterized membrane protein YebE (DUF533 family)
VGDRLAVGFTAMSRKLLVWVTLGLLFFGIVGWQVYSYYSGREASKLSIWESRASLLESTRVTRPLSSEEQAELAELRRRIAAARADGAGR